MARIGVFVCWCGSNIAKTEDVERVAAEAGKIPGVAHAADYKYMCSQPGQAMLREAIAEHRLDRVVVAACSPRLHEATFRTCIAKAGLNPFMAEIANIREHCSWVHGDRAVATPKALDLTRMAVARSRRNEALVQTEIPLTKRALVVGGGIAGIQAALDIADAGYQVTLVERSPSIGGRMAQYDKTFPTLDCAACILTPKMVECASNPNIRIVTHAEVESVSGFVGNFEVTVRRRARSVDLEKCTGCGICYEKCPVKVPSEFDGGLGMRKAIYVPFPQAVPNVPVIDREHCTYYLRGKCKLCEKFCSIGAVRFDEKDEVSTERVGAIVAATGFGRYSCR